MFYLRLILALGYPCISINYYKYSVCSTMYMYLDIVRFENFTSHQNKTLENISLSFLLSDYLEKREVGIQEYEDKIRVRIAAKKAAEKEVAVKGKNITI